MPTVDLAKRRRIMQRSQKLGHCVCEPRRPCPCDVFRNEGICPCAGERPAATDGQAVRLTELAHGGGCASKIPAADLEAILSRLPRVDDPAVVSGVAAGDDAGVYQLDEQTLLVQTVDVMSPVVDDPYVFGQICAANCVSDIYAMGGRPRTALSIVGFPSETHSGELMYQMLAGAMQTLGEAGVALIGGHSIKDDQVKLGFAITGTIEREKLASLETARPGDVLVLTKPLGTGVLTFAAQVGRPVDLSAAGESMAALNAPAAEAMNEVGVSACTDITGFGLFGHLVRMARQSGVTAQVWADRLPALPGVLEALADGVVPGASERNREFVADDLAVDAGVSDERVELGFDAQTSGGLLMSVPAARQAALLAALKRRGVAGHVIGRILSEGGPRIQVGRSGESSAPAGEAMSTPSAAPVIATSGAACCDAPAVVAPVEAKAQALVGAPTSSSPCCAQPAGQAGAMDEPSGMSAQALQAFGQFMRVAAEGGAVDEWTKELINFSLAVLTRCAPCVTAHVEKARAMGLTAEQLEEAAWCAVAMGGGPVRMFWSEARSQLDDPGSGKKGCC